MLNYDGVTFEDASIAFHEKVSNLNIRRCRLCKEGHLITEPCDGEYCCDRCTKLLNKDINWFASDYANPGLPPQYLPRLSLVENQLIATVSIQKLVYRRGFNGPIATKGHCLQMT